MWRVRLGTRGSPLALAQAEEVRHRLLALHGALDIETVVIRTTGDRIQDRTLAEAGGKGLFTKEIEEALADKTIDFAVHSMKDVPTWLPQGLEMCCLLPRADVRDAWFARCGETLESLPAGAVVGTASLRRQAQVLARRPDLRVIPFRGNVGTRLTKLAAGEVDATLLAMAGLVRLHHPDPPTAVLEPEIMLPAVAQGAIGIEVRADDFETRALLTPLHCAATGACVNAERALLEVLDGSCRTPIAALARLDEEGVLYLEGLALRPDGRQSFRVCRSGDPEDADSLGRSAGQTLREQLPADFFAC